MRLRFGNLRRDLLVWALLAFLFVFLIWPIFLTVRGGFASPEGHFTFAYILSIFRDPVLLAGMGHSLFIALCTTLLSLAIAMPLALLAARYDFGGKALLSALLLVPLILPPFVGAIGLRALLGRFGALNALLIEMGLITEGIDWLGGSLWGGPLAAIIVMEALHLYPIVFLNLAAALANVDPALDEAARNLGAGRWRRFSRITLPLILPGIFAGCAIVFIWSFTELGTPLMFDYYTVTPVQVFFGIQEMAVSPRPYALVVVMLAVAAGLYALSKLALGRRAYAMQGKAMIGSSTIALRGWRAFGAAGAFAGVFAVAVLPHIGVVISSITVDGFWYRSILPQRITSDHYAGALTHDLAMVSIRNSLFYAALAMTVCVFVGLAIAYLHVRMRVRGGWLLDALAMLPLAVPGLVMAFGYVAMTLSWPFHEGGPLHWMFSVVGAAPNPVALLVIAYAVRRLPYVVRSIAAGLEQTSGDLEDAARNLGAGTLMTLRRVVVPLIMANLIAGAILAFSFAMLEVADSLILAQREEHYPITKAIYALFNRLGDGPYIASAMGVWGMALLSVTLLGASLLLGRRLGALFRI